MSRSMRLVAGCLAAVVLTTVAAKLTADGAKTVQIRDDCDPATFNAGPPVGPGLGVICGGDGDTTFGDFIAELQATQVAEKWRFNPDRLDEPRTLVARNRGGETHTFTPVEHFGGGVVPVLNKLSGNPTPAKECLDGAKFGASVVLSGGHSDPVAAAPGAQFQCCIHPWMRLTVSK